MRIPGQRAGRIRNIPTSVSSCTERARATFRALMLLGAQRFPDLNAQTFQTGLRLITGSWGT